MKNLILTFIVVLLPFLGISQVSVDAEEIIQKLNNGEAAHYENVTIKGNIDFRLITDKEEVKEKANVVFDNDITYKYHVNAPLKFSNCIFTGNIIGYYYDDDEDELHIVMFHEDVSFEKCTFQSDFLVKYTEFFKNASFASNTFQEECLFKYAEFNSSVDFTNSVFEEEANFKYTEFPAYTNFSNSKFEGEANFKYTEFDDKIEFKNCEFSELAVFKYTEFDEYVDFTGTKFQAEAIFKYTEFPEGVSFENAYFDGAKYGNTGNVTITNIEILAATADTASVRAMFYNPMQLPRMTELSYCGGYYHHELVRTGDGWRLYLL